MRVCVYTMVQEINCEEEDITILVGSNNKITIDKLYGPACVDNLKIVWEGGDWNVRNIIYRLRKENRILKNKLKEKKIWHEDYNCFLRPSDVEMYEDKIQEEKRDREPEVIQDGY